MSQYFMARLYRATFLKQRQLMVQFEQAPPEARALLGVPIRDLGLSLEASPVAQLVQKMYDELEARGLHRFRPPCYLTDEWGCPSEEPVIGIPFYLGDPRVANIEDALNDVESEHEIMMYLRHEAGHAFNYAYELYRTEEWHALFGSFRRPYRDDYPFVPFSRDYVRHIAAWYAQKHPDEDFAETFAVWLTPSSDWRTRYAGTGALRKLEYVDHVLHAVGPQPPMVKPTRRGMTVEEVTYTVGDYYDRRREPRVEIPKLWFDGDLRQLFDDDGAPAVPLLRRHRLAFVEEASYWTGVQPGVVRSLVDHLIARVEALDLRIGEDELRYVVSFTAMVTTLTNNYLHHATFVSERR